MSSTLTFGHHLPENESFTNGSYYELLRLTGARFTDYYDLVSNKTVGQSFSSIGPDFAVLLQHNPSYKSDIVTALLGAVGLTLIRLTLNHLLIPLLLRHRLLAPKDGDRFAESFYTHIFYTISFVMAAVIEGQNEYLSHPERLWAGFSLSEAVPNLVWYLYELQTAHYLHCMYAILYINKWSKDSAVLFFHHNVALLLISISYLNRTYRLGVLVMYLHDICDVIMEGCKCLIKLQLTNRVMVKVADAARIVGFGLFVFFWFVFRLYFFPLKVIYPAVLYLSSNSVNTWFPLSFLLYFLLWFIFTMNVYWATLIIKVLINVIRGADLDDIREVDDEVIVVPDQNGKSAKKSD